MSRSSTTTSDQLRSSRAKPGISFPLGRRLLFLLAVCSVGCLAPPKASERAADAARQLNVASRFGRMDLALEATAPSFRGEFMRRHAHWGNSIRVLDVELAGLTMKASNHAVLLVDVSWAHMASGLMQSTRLEQTWMDQGRGFELTEERRVAGDLGLFGEALEVTEEPHPNVHFPTKTIR